MPQRPYSVPADASLIFPDYPEAPGVQAASLTSIQSQVDHYNGQTLGFFNQACSNWLQTNAQNAALGLPLTPKPPQPGRQTLNVVVADFNGQVISGGAGYAWAWIAYSGLLGSPCPNVGVPAPARIHVGPRIPKTISYRVMPDDTMPVGAVVAAPDKNRVQKVRASQYSCLYKITSSIFSVR